MTIVIDAEPANRAGRTGVENVTLKLIEEFIKIDSENPERQYVLITKNDLRSDFPKLPSNFSHIRASWPTKYFWAHLRLPLALRRIKPDITFIPADIVSSLCPNPVATVIHDVAFLEQPESYRWFSLRAQKFALGSALKKAKVIITPTLFVADALKKHFPNLQNQIEVVHWGVDAGIYNPSSKTTDRQRLVTLGLADKRYFIYVGRLESKKNSSNLLKAFEVFYKEQPGIDLVLVGQNTENLPTGPAKFLGYQDNETIAELLRRSLALVYPSLAEGFGLPVLEAQACGCPVIASDLPVLREVGGQAAYFIDPADQEALSQAFRTLANEPNLRASLSQAGLANSQRYSWVQAGQKVLDILLRMV